MNLLIDAAAFFLIAAGTLLLAVAVHTVVELIRKRKDRDE